MSNFIMLEHKKSIRFFNDREVRAVWDEEQNCWWFSATDIVRAISTTNLTTLKLVTTGDGLKGS